ncbi:PaaI family thioesterase [Rhodococcus chondri]|uniref:Acyl-coenzyme A thioesterase THEM4 n=1 Tax=Rhodococcus chondri TaxID=3065941 RepID=A0ABU7JP88_9NOCA|nr:PaaI family thioesterase [Rhodococcus sp. CC-R104]MEE2031289.1 PaaI family thioesterase [Rhodococcus sp. CC-R104]
MSHDRPDAAVESSDVGGGWSSVSHRGFDAGVHREQPAPYDAMIATARAMLDDLAGANPPLGVVEKVAGHFADVQKLVADHQVSERRRPFGHLDVPGRAQCMSPALLVDRWDRGGLEGTVTFGKYYLGGNGAAHGGTIPLMFDEVLGRLASTDRTPCRTAYLHVDFRSITPIDEELTVSGWFDREEGRKRYLRAELRHGDVLCAEAEGLFIELKPGQP